MQGYIDDFAFFKRQLIEKDVQKLYLGTETPLSLLATAYWNFDDLIPTTLIPTTLEPTTLEPSTTEPSTLEPSTSEPSTLEPSTTEPSTLEPSTSEPSTSEPSTLEPSTSEPSTLEASTLEPSTTEPSTLEASTLEPTTTSPSTSVPTTTESSTSEPSTTTSSTLNPSTLQPTNIPSTSVPSTTTSSTSTISSTSTLNPTINPTSGPNVTIDPLSFCQISSWMSQYKLECVQLNNDSFLVISNNGNNITLNEKIQISKTIYFQENLFFGSNAYITIILNNLNQKKQIQSTNALLKTSGCVDFHQDSTFLIQIDSLPPNNRTVSLVEYNCASTPLLSNQNIQIQTNFPQKCNETVSNKIDSSPSTLSVSFSTTNTCGKSISRGAIIGISVGGFLGVVGLAITVSLIAYFRKKKIDSSVNEDLRMNEFESMRSSYMKN